MASKVDRYFAKAYSEPLDKAEAKIAAADIAEAFEIPGEVVDADFMNYVDADCEAEAYTPKSLNPEKLSVWNFVPGAEGFSNTIDFAG